MQSAECRARTAEHRIKQNVERVGGSKSDLAGFAVQYTFSAILLKQYLSY